MIISEYNSLSQSVPVGNICALTLITRPKFKLTKTRNNRLQTM